jgi:hypothetical protein
MSKVWRFRWLALACVAALAVGVAVAGDEIGGEKGAGMAMPAWCAKTKEHESLKKLEGTWEVKGQCVMTGEQCTGKVVGQVVLNGHYLEQRFEGAMSGQPMESRFLLGYDTLDKEWVAIWLDGCCPVPSISRGTEKDGVITFKTNDPDWMDPAGARKEGKMTFAWKSDTSYALAMFGADGSKMMEFVYTKK